MNKTRWRRLMLGAAVMGGSLLAGPCGITTLQFKDFLTSTVIRTSVTTVASLVGAATVEQALEDEE